jgi:hypothetical protein
MLVSQGTPYTDMALSVGKVRSLAWTIATQLPNTLEVAKSPRQAIDSAPRAAPQSCHPTEKLTFSL